MQCRERSTRFVAGSAFAALTAVLLASCSPGADYPAVLDKPTPRADTPMSADQIKQATDALISDRDRLSAEVQGAGPTNAAPNGVGRAAAQPLTTGATQTAVAAPKP